MPMRSAFLFLVLLLTTVAFTGCHKRVLKPPVPWEPSEGQQQVEDSWQPEILADTGPCCCQRRVIGRVGKVEIVSLEDSRPFFFRSGMAVSADGAPDAYGPGDIGTDRLGNAGRPGHWWALATDSGQKDGSPLVQGERDPRPGYYVSMTALFDTSRDRTDPRRYVDANQVPYIVLPLDGLQGASLGDFCVVVNTHNSKVVYGLVADLGPRNKIGEGSVAMARALGVPDCPRRGGIGDGIVYLVFPGSGSSEPLQAAEIGYPASRLFQAWGGLERLLSCAHS